MTGSPGPYPPPIKSLVLFGHGILANDCLVLPGYVKLSSAALHNAALHNAAMHNVALHNALRLSEYSVLSDIVTAEKSTVKPLRLSEHS